MSAQIKFICIFLLLSVIAAASLSGRDAIEINKEIIVKFVDDIIVMPPEIDTAGKEVLAQKSSGIVNILNNSNLTHIIRAFNKHDRADSIAVNEFGDTILNTEAAF